MIFESHQNDISLPFWQYSALTAIHEMDFRRFCLVYTRHMNACEVGELCVYLGQQRRNWVKINNLFKNNRITSFGLYKIDLPFYTQFVNPQSDDRASSTRKIGKPG